MTRRETEIVRGILTVLHEQDRGQLAETQMHCAVNVSLQEAGRVSATLGEFNAALLCCDSAGWVTGVIARFGGKKWNINDGGEAALMEMR
jgi:hypothetical protein